MSFSCAESLFFAFLRPADQGIAYEVGSLAGNCPSAQEKGPLTLFSSGSSIILANGILTPPMTTENERPKKSSSLDSVCQCREHDLEELGLLSDLDLDLLRGERDLDLEEVFLFFFL